MKGLGDFCTEPNNVLEDMASDYVERGWFPAISNVSPMGIGYCVTNDMVAY